MLRQRQLANGTLTVRYTFTFPNTPSNAPTDLDADLWIAQPVVTCTT